MKKWILVLAFIGLIIESSYAQENHIVLKLGDKAIDLEKGVDHKDVRGYLSATRESDETYSYSIAKIEAFLSEGSKAKAQTTGEGGRVLLNPFTNAARKGDVLFIRIMEMYSIDKAGAKERIEAGSVFSIPIF